MNTNHVRWNLHRYEIIKQDVDKLRIELDEYRKMNISGIKAQVITNDPICHGAPDSEGDIWHSKVEKMAATRLEYIDRLTADYDEKRRIIRAIDSVYDYIEDPKHKQIINLRYFVTPQGRSKYNWLEIARAVNYSEDNCKKIDCKIVRQIQLRLLENFTHSVHVCTETA